MPKLNYIQGNLFETNREIIGHSVNCRGAFGSGVAGQIAKLYPLARQAYLNKFKTDKWHLGEIQLCPIDKDGRQIVIANMAMQDTYGKTGVHVDYKACFQAFSKLFRYASMHNDGIALPKLGAGLAGGSWLEVEKALLSALAPYDIEVDVYYL
jgi:O-acetyl-ADP-ribose deacetylase (regulator of RNase III)